MTTQEQTEEATPEEVAEVTEQLEAAEDAVTHPGDHAGIIARINYVQQLIDYVGKTGTSGDGYNFRTIDGVLKALHGPLGRAGVVITPNVKKFKERPWHGYKLYGTLNAKLDSFAGSQEGIAAQMANQELVEMANPNRIVQLKVEYQFHCEPAPGGRNNAKTEHSVIGWGEGIDNSDKAVGKAMSYGYKAMMSQVFSIPTEQPEMDNEHLNQRDQQQGAATASPWWESAGWQSEQQAKEARKQLTDQLRILPPLVAENAKKWMSAFELEQGGWQRATVMRDAKAQRLAATFSLTDAQSLQDKLDDLAEASKMEREGGEPFELIARQEDGEEPVADGDAEATEEPADAEEPVADGDAEATEEPADAEPSRSMRFLFALSESPGLTVTKISEATGMSRRETEATLQTMVNDGDLTLEKVGRSNVYTLAAREAAEPEPAEQGTLDTQSE